MGGGEAGESRSGPVLTGIGVPPTSRVGASCGALRQGSPDSWGREVLRVVGCGLRVAVGVLGFSFRTGRRLPGAGGEDFRGDEPQESSGRRFGATRCVANGFAKGTTLRSGASWRNGSVPLVVAQVVWEASLRRRGKGGSVARGSRQAHPTTVRASGKRAVRTATAGATPHAGEQPQGSQRPREGRAIFARGRLCRGRAHERSAARNKAAKLELARKPSRG